jgi:hypothetical protein
MSDMSMSTRRSHRPPRTEFNLYFGAIFVAALPFATLGWARDAALGRGLTARNPVGRALSEARRITPMIFSA